MADDTILKAGPGFTLPEADTGSFQAAQSSFAEGWARSVGGTAWRAGHYLYLREMGKTPLTQEKYEESYQGIFDYKEGMTEEEAESRLNHHVTDSLRAANMGGHQEVSFVGSMAGSILSPDLILFAAAPELKFLNLANTTRKTGSALLAANAARFSARRLADNVANASLNAGLQNMAMEPFVYGLDTFVGRKHGLDESAMNIMAGFGMGALIGTGRTAWHAYSPDVRQALARAALRSSLNGETADPMVGAMAGMTDPSVRRATQAVGDELRSKDIPDDISTMEGQADARRTGYVSEEIQSIRERLEHETARRHVTKSLVERDAAPRKAHAERTELFRKAAREAANDDEMLLDEAFRRIFGTGVKYVDGDVAGETGILGLFDAKDPQQIYIRAGNLDDAGINMLRIAGHEMGHVIRSRDPDLWLSMVDTMLDPNIARHFSESWKEVRSAKKASNLWGSMTYHERMDEVLATILGHGMQTPDFWVSLNKRAGADGRKLAGYLLKVHDTVAQLVKDRLGLPGGAKVHAMEKQLAKAVSALDESGQYKFASKKTAVSSWERAINKSGQPLGSDKKPIIYEGYRARREAFRSHEQRVYDQINAAGLKNEQRIANLDSTIEALFPEAGSRAGTVRDRSATPGATDLKITRTKAVKGDPRNYLVKVFFKNLPDEAAQKSFRTLITKTAQKYSASRDFLNTIMEQGPLATYERVGVDERTGDPLYEFNIYLNDKSPMWSENRAPEDFEIDDVRLQLKEHYSKLASTFVEELKAGEDKTGAPDDRYQIFEAEAGQFINSLSPEDLYEMSTQDLIDAYHSHLDEQMHLALVRGDEKRYANLADMRNEEAPASPEDGSQEKPRTLYQRVEEARSTARRVFEIVNKQAFEPFDPDKDYTLPELPSGDVQTLGVTGAFDVLRAKMFEERIEMLKDDPEAEFLYGAMTDGQRETFHENLRAEIDRAIYDTHPNLRMAMSEKVQNTLIGKEQTPVMTSQDWILESGNILDDDANWRSDAEAMDMPLDEMLRQAKQAAGARKAESDAAVARALGALDINHKEYSTWLTDVAGMVNKDLPDLLKRNNLIDFEVEDKPRVMGEEPPPTPERTKAEERLFQTLSGLKKGMRMALADLNDVVQGKPRKRGDDAPETDYTKDRFDLHMRMTNNDRWKSAEAAAKDTKDYYTNRMRGEVLAHEAAKRIQSKARKSPKHLFSWLDGQARVGVTGAGDSVDARRRAQAVADLTPLDQVLARYGLRDHWINNTLVEAVLKYIDTGTAKTEEVKLIGDTLRKVVDTQAGRINSLGGAYRMLPRYAFSQVHDGARITGNREAWTTYLMENIDWELTEKFVGKLDTDKKKQAYLDGVFEAVTQRKDDALAIEEDGGNILNETALRRTIHLKPARGYEYDMMWGSGNTGAEIVSQIMRRGEKSAIMDAFGPKYRATWSEAMSSMGVQFSNKFSDLRMMDETFHQIIGTWDNPVDAGLASMAKATRNVANSAALWLAGVSSITDIGHIVSTLRWAGVDPKNLHSRVLEGLAEAARDDKGRQALQGAGAGMQAITSAYSRILGNSWFEQTAQKLSDFTFKYSGTELSTKLYQEAMFDFMTEHLGSQGSTRVTPEFRSWLDHYGITPDEWKAMAEHTAPVQGLGDMPRLSPDLIPDQKLALKLRAALHDTMTYGQLQPNVSDEALLRFGTKAGTVGGETVRFIGQYKGYALAVVNKVRARFKYAYGSVDAPVAGFIPKGRGLEESLAWSASMITLAWMALGIKDVLRGNEPLNPLEQDHWTWGNATRVLAQAGVGPLAQIEQFLSMRQALGPVPGSLWRLGEAAADDRPGSGYRKTEAVFGALPGASIAPLQEARRQIIGSVFSDAYMGALENAQEFRQEATGQDRALDFTTD